MSFAVYSHALKQQVGNATAKLILLGLAEHAHDDGTAAFPSKATLAVYAECSERTVQRHLGDLRRRGFIRIGDQRYVDHIRRDQRPTVYNVATSTEQQHTWATAADCGEAPVSPRKERGAKMSPRSNAAEHQVTRGDKMSPRERGVKPGPNGETQLCLPNPPMNPPPPPTPSMVSRLAPGAEAAEDSANEAGDFVASLPGGLTERQTARLATQVSKRLLSGWSTSALRKELTTDTDNVRSHFAVYEHRVRHLPNDPPPTRATSKTTPAPVEGLHIFVVAADDDWCAQCHRPASNAVHRRQGNETTAPIRRHAAPARRSDAALTA